MTTYMHTGWEYSYSVFLFVTAVLVAEVTQPSLGVGYEIGRAVAMKKRILCLFRPESGRSMRHTKLISSYSSFIIHIVCTGLSAMVQGAHDGNLFVVKSYREAEAECILQDYFTS